MVSTLDYVILRLPYFGVIMTIEVGSSQTLVSASHCENSLQVIIDVDSSS